MPSFRRLIAVAALPESRRLVVRAWRARDPRAVAAQIRRGPAGLRTGLGGRAATAHRVRRVVGHPATRELVTVGLALLPLRYTPVGWAALWLAGRAAGTDRGGSDARHKPRRG